MPTRKTTSISWPDLLREARTRFHIQRFRPGQREVIASVLSGQDTLALMPTGAGKSLTYQLPALFLPKPVIVVSPLIALMQDQQEKAAQADVVVEKLDSTARRADREQAHRDIAENSAQLIYVTPEKLSDAGFLAELNAAGGISLLVIDEAHTIAQWGHDFRPAFLAIGQARKTLGNPPILALTATATEEVVAEILTSLHAPHATRISTGIERPNLAFSVHPTVNNEAKVARILAMIKEDEGAGIIYTASVRAANDLFDLLTDQGIAVGHYHGKMPTRDRERVQQEFMRGDHKVMIATKAFGLGIDKPDIRFVFHFEFPDSLETYYQEAGRAGRDGLPARAVLLYRLEDKRIQTFFLAGRYPRPTELEAVYQALTPTPDLAEPAPPPSQPANTFVINAETGTAAPPTTPKPASKPAKITPSDLIAERASVSKRRTQVILNLLTESKLIRRTRTGYVPTTTQPPDQAHLESLLQTYIDRAARDKDRLAEMMHYAETPTCRVQIIRAYFSEPEAGRCGRCDNCLRTQPQPGSPHPPVSGPETALTPHQPITIIETLHGSIRTTAPETLPTPIPAAPFSPGDQVRHKRFGPGHVLDIHGDNILVAFAKSGQKRLRANFLLPA